MSLTPAKAPRTVRQRIVEMNAEIAAARLKAKRIEHAIRSRQTTLSRLHAKLAFNSDLSAALPCNE